jgi:hypothetical protein
MNAAVARSLKRAGPPLSASKDAGRPIIGNDTADLFAALSEFPTTLLQIFQ